MKTKLSSLLFAICLASGYVVAAPDESAARWEADARKGNASAQCHLGNCYMHGRGVEKDIAPAVTWYRKAAMQGHTDAQYMVGICYANGEGLTKNAVEALKWYRKAAGQGVEYAQKAVKRLSR